jgi:hypothetical protein
MADAQDTPGAVESTQRTQREPRRESMISMHMLWCGVALFVLVLGIVGGLVVLAHLGD